MIQIASQHDLQQNLLLLVALGIPVGDDGTEYGGIDSAITDRPLDIEESFFLQLAYYY